MFKFDFNKHSLQILSLIGYKILSPTCTLCRGSGQQSLDLCRDCEQELPWLADACYRCALPLETTNLTNLCGHCLQNPPHYNRTISLFHYQSPIDRLINHLKFHQRLANANIFSQLLFKKVQQAYQHSTLPECIIPIPLHRKRLQQRGYNQALELAKPLAKNLNIKLDKFSCQRIVNTPQQSTLKAPQRRKNLRNAFGIQNLSAKHIAIVDDVMTTGSTVNEFSHALRLTGVERIDVWVCARTVI